MCGSGLNAGTNVIRISVFECALVDLGECGIEGVKISAALIKTI